VNDFFLGLAGAIDGGALQAAALWTLRTVPGFPPIIQTVHILGIAAVMGSVVMINLRMLGLALPSQSLSEMNGRLFPWLWWALASNLVSGGFFLFARPFRYFDNPVFLWKLAFLVPALLLSLVIWRLNRQEGFWTRSRWQSISGKLLALASLALWLMTAMAGRWIAYAEYLYYPA
jgi:hypothetical protein